MSDALATWFKALKEGPELAHINKAKSHAVGFAYGVRAGGEGGIIGALYGMINAVVPNGLDQRVGMLPKPVPLDGVGALIGMGAAGALGADSGIMPEACNLACASGALFGFRQMQNFIHERQISPSSVKSAFKSASAHGEIPRAGSSSHIGAEFGSEHDPVMQAVDAIERVTG